MQIFQSIMNWFLVFLALAGLVIGWLFFGKRKERAGIMSGSIGTHCRMAAISLISVVGETSSKSVPRVFQYSSNARSLFFSFA